MNSKLLQQNQQNSQRSDKSFWRIAKRITLFLILTPVVFLVACFSYACAYPIISTNLYSPHKAYQEVLKEIKDNHIDIKKANSWYEQNVDKYVDKIKTYEDTRKYATVAVKELGDQYTRILSKEDSESESKAMLGEKQTLFGFKYKIDENSALPVITEIIPDSPAMKEGIKAGDLIDSFDNLRLKGKSRTDVENTISASTPKSAHIFSIRRNKESIRLRITPKPIEDKPVTWKSLSPNTGYIQISSLLSDKVAHEFRAALKKLGQKKHIVLDLQDNSGGQLKQAYLIASLFIKTGTLMQEEDRVTGKNKFSRTLIELEPKKIIVREQDKKSIETFERLPCTAYCKQLSILINEGTASAAEILASSLKENAKATLIGENSFGKGCGQVVQSLYADDKSKITMHITSFQWLTPSGKSVSTGKDPGLHPDIVVERTESMDDAQYKKLCLEKAKLAN